MKFIFKIMFICALILPVNLAKASESDQIDMLAMIWVGKDICNYKIIEGSFDRYAIKNHELSLWTFGDLVNDKLPDMRSMMIYSPKLSRTQICDWAIMNGKKNSLIRIKRYIETLNNVEPFANLFLYNVARCKLEVSAFGNEFINDFNNMQSAKITAEEFARSDKFWKGIEAKAMCAE